MKLRPLVLALAALFLVSSCAQQEAAEPAPDTTWVGTITTEGNVTTVVNESGSVWGGTATLVEEVSIGVLASTPSIDAQDSAGQPLEPPGPLEDVRPFRVLESFGPEDYLYNPSGLAFGSDGQLYVLDSGNNRVVVFSPDGVFVRSFGRSGEGPGEFRASPGSDDDIAVEGDTVLVLEVLRRRVQLFDSSGEYLHGFTQSKIAKGVAMRGTDIYLGTTPTGAGTPAVIVSEMNGSVTREMGEAAISSPPGRLFLDSRRFDISASGGILQAFWMFPLLKILDNDSQSDYWYDFSWWGEPGLAAWYTQFDQGAFESLRDAYSKGTLARGDPDEPALPNRVVFSDMGCARGAPVCALLLARGIVQFVAEDGRPMDSYRLLPPGESRPHNPVAIAVTEDGRAFCVADRTESLVSCYRKATERRPDSGLVQKSAGALPPWSPSLKATWIGLQSFGEISSSPGRKTTPAPSW